VLLLVSTFGIGEKLTTPIGETAKIPDGGILGDTCTGSDMFPCIAHSSITCNLWPCGALMCCDSRSCVRTGTEGRGVLGVNVERGKGQGGMCGVC
jgi:hypothetical protein